jgi:hypothetical protein
MLAATPQGRKCLGKKTTAEIGQKSERNPGQNDAFLAMHHNSAVISGAGLSFVAEAQRLLCG